MTTDTRSTDGARAAREIALAEKEVRDAEDSVRLFSREGVEALRLEASERLDRAKAKLRSVRFFWEDGGKKKSVRLRFWDTPVRLKPLTHAERLKKVNENNAKFWQRRS